MTDRKFTPPTEFPAEYVTSDVLKAVILGPVPMESVSDLHDIPEKQVHWANDYGDFPGHWSDSREDADAHAGPDRIAVIRREWVEGQPPQYFTEEV